MTGSSKRRVLSTAVAATIIAIGSASLCSAQESSEDIAASNFALTGRPTRAMPNYSGGQSESSTPGLLQNWMRDSGMDGGFGDQYRLMIGGYAEAGYTFNFNEPSSGDNGLGRIFDAKSEDNRLDQISLYVMREAVWSRDTFDFGFGFQMIYGSDSKFIHANGANFYGSGYDQTPIQQYPDEQFDLTQLFFTVNLPVGNGLMMTAGKFVTPWGLEHIDPTKNLFYSHSMTFSRVSPKTLTGITGAYRIDEQFVVTGGVVTGWDQSIEDNNDMPSVLAQLSYRYSDDWDFVFTGIVGPEQPNNRSDTRWMVDGTAVYHAQREWTIGFEGVVLYEPEVGTQFKDVEPTNAQGIPIGPVQRQFTFTGGSELLFSGIVYSSWRIDPMWTVNFRLEYLNDSDGGRYFPVELWSATAGVSITPFPDHEIGKYLVLRPEVRYDYSEDDIFDGGAQNTQVTAGIDAIFKF